MSDTSVSDTGVSDQCVGCAVSDTVSQIEVAKSDRGVRLWCQIVESDRCKICESDTLCQIKMSDVLCQIGCVS